MIWCWQGSVRVQSILKTWKSPVPAGTAHSLTFYVINKSVTVGTLLVVCRIFISPVSVTLSAVSTRLNLLSLRNIINSYFLSHLFAYDVSTHVRNNPNHHMDMVKLLFTGIAFKNWWFWAWKTLYDKWEL